MTQLSTARLVLRPARPEDAPHYALAIGEYAIARWLTQLPWPYSLSMASEFLRMAPPNCPERALFIIDLPGKGLIGAISLIDEFGFWIARSHWGRGYVTEAATALIDWHFAHGTSEAINSSAQWDNKPSLRVQAKLGFVEQERQMRFSQALQHNVEHVVTSLSRTQWLARGALACA